MNELQKRPFPEDDHRTFENLIQDYFEKMSESLGEISYLGRQCKTDEVNDRILAGLVRFELKLEKIKKELANKSTPC